MLFANWIATFSVYMVYLIIDVFHRHFLHLIDTRLKLANYTL